MEREAPTMRAVAYERYGSFDQLRVRQVTQPTPKRHEVAVSVVATALHIGDCFSVRGSPFAMRLATGLLKPKYGIPGFDVAGRVHSVGASVTRFKPGDAVFGTCRGACAEYAVARESTLAPKPTRRTFPEAAAVPTSALTALHAMRDTARVESGQKVLINGASGGVGSFAVQIAKALGADVTGVCGSANVALVRSLGADRVIDYTQEDFTKGANSYDVILDNVENRSLSDCRRALRRGGTLVLNSGTGASGIRMLIRLVRPLLLSPFLRERLRRFVSAPNYRDLEVLTSLIDSGALRPVIDKVFPLEETAVALRYIEGGHARGKVVITL